MKKLPIQFRKYGYDYEQVERTEHAAIYSQKSDGRLIAYDVVKIRIKKERILFGQKQSEQEIYPSSEEWGSIAWTIPKNQLDRAIEIMQKITAHEKSKISMSIASETSEKEKVVLGVQSVEKVA